MLQWVFKGLIYDLSNGERLMGLKLNKAKQRRNGIGKATDISKRVKISMYKTVVRQIIVISLTKAFEITIYPVFN